MRSLKSLCRNFLLVAVMEDVNLPNSFSGYLPVGLRILILCTGAGTRVGSSRGRGACREWGQTQVQQKHSEFVGHSGGESQHLLHYSRN